MSLRDALARIHRAHRLIECWPSLKDRFAGTNRSWECNCGWTSPEPYSTRSDHPEHIADLQIAYLRDNLAQHAEFFADLTIHQRRLIARHTTGWSRADD